MPGSKRWADLSSSQQERLIGLMMTLQEFSYGLDQSGLVALASEEGSAVQRFFSNALYQYCANLFLVSGHKRLREFMSEIDCDDLLQPVDAVLASPLGNTTLRFVLGVFRDKFLVHTTHVFDLVEDQLRGKVDLSNPEVQDRLGVLVFEAFSRTKDLFENLGTRFPQPWTRLPEASG